MFILLNILGTIYKQMYNSIHSVHCSRIGRIDKQEVLIIEFILNDIVFLRSLFYRHKLLSGNSNFGHFEFWISIE